MKEAESERIEKIKEVELEKLRKIEQSEKEKRKVDIEKARMKKETDIELAEKELQKVSVKVEGTVKIAESTRIGEENKEKMKTEVAIRKTEVFLESIKQRTSTTKMLLDAAKDEKDKETKMEYLRMLAGVVNRPTTEAITDRGKSDQEMHT